MFLVDWAVKIRIRPPKLETSICDAKYHVSLIILFSFGNLVDRSDLIGDRSYGEVSVMEMKRILTKESRSSRGPDWRYLSQATEKSRVLVIPVGARHKCQQGIRFERPIIENEVLNQGPRPAAAACGGANMSARWSARERAWSRLIADGRCFYLARASRSVLHHSRDDVAPLLQITADAWCFCAMQRRDGRRTVAYDVAQAVAHAGRPDAAPARHWSTPDRLLADVMRAVCCVLWSRRCA
ncbi:hypothetical protein F511_28070 [Dorcoceras hygrometricum]|uniref:Uncharacterized protein n=1 Tax=Dorcoceras hygrometricum TaxID=472368 RepID=A0A2Z7BIK7_9LAMI|nr:hypothetical protein F511_28070 [Dorcoceras hygrometricum]